MCLVTRGAAADHGSKAAMSTPVRITRPYRSLEEFLENDAWTVDRSSMLLLGAESFEAGAEVTFDIVLESGESAVAGDGRVVEWTAGVDEQPSALRVKFRKLDANSKAVLKRALEIRRAYARAAAGEAEAAAPPAEPAQQEPPVAPAHKSGVHARTARAVVPPANRDALLERLRERARTMAKAGVVHVPNRRSAAE